MKKILVPTDLSPVSELGLQLAIEIAKRSSALVELINFTKHPWGKTFSAMGEIAVEAETVEELEALQYLKGIKSKLAELVEQYAHQDVVLSYAIVDDELKSGIDKYLRDHEIDLIIMGTSGEETGEEVFKGNHTEQVIKISSCPVLSVRDGFNINCFDNIVVAVDVIVNTQVAEGLKTLRQIADCFNAHIHLVHIQEPNGHNTAMLYDYFVKMAVVAGLQNYSIHIMEAEDEADRVIAYARDVRAGLIAVLKNSNPPGIFRVLSPRFSDRLVKEVGRPVFTVNIQNGISPSVDTKC